MARDPSSMRLVLISRGCTSASAKLLRAAAEARGVAVEVVAADTAVFDLRPLESVGTMLYRTSIDPQDRLLEQALQSPDVASCRNTLTSIYGYYNKMCQASLLQEQGVPVAKTCFTRSTARAELEQVIERLGLPVVIKVFPGTLGVGVGRVDSYISLKTMAEILVARGIDFVYQEFVAAAEGRQRRVVVLEGRAIACYENRLIEADEFRTNAVDGVSERVAVAAVEPELEAIAVAAAEALGLGFAGIDVLPYGPGAWVVAEVNFPFNFGLAQAATSVDIAGMLIDALSARALR